MKVGMWYKHLCWQLWDMDDSSWHIFQLSVFYVQVLQLFALQICICQWNTFVSYEFLNDAVQ